MSVEIRNITEESFARYGTVIRHDPGKAELFQVVVQEPAAAGWNIAVCKVTARVVTRIARHPNSRESFEPLEGVTLLCVAEDDPARFEAFLLDRPVCLKKNIWHVTLALSEQSMVKITENASVDSEVHTFGREMKATVG